MILKCLGIGALLGASRKLASNYFGETALQNNLEKFGFKWTYFAFWWETSALNGLLHKAGNPHNHTLRHFIDLWFWLGAIFGIIAQAATIAILLWSIAAAISVGLSSHSLASAALASWLPPLTGDSEGGGGVGASSLVFWSAAAVCFIIHELGHAAAATRQQLRVFRTGAFATCLFPGAYVRVEDLLLHIPPFPQLTVAAAGVWHNAALCVFCVISVALGSAIVSSPVGALVYNSGVGAVVASIPKGSPFEGSLRPGDVITAVGGARIGSVADVKSTVAEKMRTTEGVQQAMRINSGFCVPSDFDIGALALESLDLRFNSRTENCCDQVFREGGGEYDEEDPRHCFVTHETPSLDGEPKWRAHSCLLTSTLSTVLPLPPSGAMCRSSADCMTDFDPNTSSSSSSSNPSMLCLRPLTYPEILLLSVTARRGIGYNTGSGAVDTKPTSFTLLFEGDTTTLPSSLDLSDLEPTSAMWSILPAWLVHMLVSSPPSIRRFLSLLSQISASMAVLNTVPVYGLDGASIGRQVLRIVWGGGRGGGSENQRHSADRAATMLTALGTILLVVELALCAVASATMVGEDEPPIEWR